MTLFNYNVDTKMTEQIEAFRLKLQMSANKPKADNLNDALHRIRALETSQAELLRLHSATYDLLQDLVRVVSTSSHATPPLHRELCTELPSPRHCPSQPEPHIGLPSSLCSTAGSQPAKEQPAEHLPSQNDIEQVKVEK